MDIIHRIKEMHASFEKHSKVIWDEKWLNIAPIQSDYGGELKNEDL